jgi:hypothetical protein
LIRLVNFGPTFDKYDVTESVRAKKALKKALSFIQTGLYSGSIAHDVRQMVKQSAINQDL